MMHRRQFLSASTSAALGCLAAPAILRAAPHASEDIRLLGELLRSLHPGLHRYLGPAQFEQALVRLDQHWRDFPSLEARFLNLTRFLAALRCGHSYPSFYNQRRPVAATLFGRQDRLPFAFRWIGREMVVTQSHAPGIWLPRGSVIKAVNEVSASTILARLLPLIRADGGNDGKRRALLSPTGADEIESFDVLYGLTFGVPADGIFKVRYRAPGTPADVWADMPAIDLAARQAFIRAPDPRSNAPIWSWNIAQTGVATLTMPGWALYNSQWDWRTWLTERLGDLGGAKGLIIDLRENEGGDDCGDLILARLAGQDIPAPAEDRLVRYRQVPASLNRYLDTWDDGFRDWGARATRHSTRYWRLDPDESAAPLRRAGPQLNLPVAVLIGPQNSSATFRFASLIKSNRLATLIGGTTGGNRRGINGGAFFFARLPESGIEFDLPLIGYFPRRAQPDAGITPDIRVETSAADVAAGYDRVLQTAHDWINHI